jgi:hypothetical protein
MVPNSRGDGTQQAADKSEVEENQFLIPGCQFLVPKLSEKTGCQFSVVGSRFSGIYLFLPLRNLSHRAVGVIDRTIRIGISPGVGIGDGETAKGFASYFAGSFTCLQPEAVP